jgi:UDP-N-acetylglucosamine 2-epimerase (non-hydrolysing)
MIAVVFGTRPEAIKMAPVVRALETSPHFAPYVIVTAQHRDMLDAVLGFFGVRPEHDLDLFQRGHTLSEVLAGAVLGLTKIFQAHRPDFVLVQGDTTTTLASALAAFYSKIPVGHVEAGLRTYNALAPYPEEMNRRATSHIATLHFAPTRKARANLCAEGIPPETITVTGNTVIDALHWALAQPVRPEASLLAEVIADPRRMVLVTAHRRESWGDQLREIGRGVADIAAEHPELMIVFPIHGNPDVRAMVMPALDGLPNVVVTEPMPYGDFVQLMRRADIILTDSGGIQEEAPSLGRPVLVMRDVTERPEAIQEGAAHLVGTNREAIARAVDDALADPARFTAGVRNVFGDGKASARIAQRIGAHFNLCPIPEEFTALDV